MLLGPQKMLENTLDQARADRISDRYRSYGGCAMRRRVWKLHQPAWRPCHPDSVLGEDRAMAVSKFPLTDREMACQAYRASGNKATSTRGRPGDAFCKGQMVLATRRMMPAMEVCSAERWLNIAAQGTLASSASRHGLVLATQPRRASKPLLQTHRNPLWSGSPVSPDLQYQRILFMRMQAVMMSEAC